MNGLIAISAILVVVSSGEAQFVGYSPVLRNSLNPNTRPDPPRGEQKPGEQSTCVEWRTPTTYDKLIAPYATRTCVKWQPLLNGNGGNSGNSGGGNNGGNSYPGFGYGYNPFNNGGYNGNGMNRMSGVSGGFNGGFSNPYSGFSGFSGFNGGGSFGNPYAGRSNFGMFGGSPVTGYNPSSSPYFRPY